MRVLVVDDEPLALRAAARALEGVEGVQVVGNARDGDEALRRIAELKPELVILDIQMPGLNGMELARALQGPDTPEVIFLTAFDRYAVDAFAVEAVDYLLKPLRPERLRQAIARARARRLRPTPSPIADGQSTGAVIHVSDRWGGHDILQSEIIWVEAAGDYALLHTEDRSHMLRATMAELGTRLRPPLLRVHRSAFVALDRVKRQLALGKGLISLELTNGVDVPVGPTYTKMVRAAMRRKACSLLGPDQADERSRKAMMPPQSR